MTIENIKTVEVGEEAHQSPRISPVPHPLSRRTGANRNCAGHELSRALTTDMASQLTAIFKPLGYKYVTLDLEGYRQGSLNEVLPRLSQTSTL